MNAAPCGGGTREMRPYLLPILLMLACTPSGSARPRAAPPPPAPLDSIVLERTACFGPCPVYRLRIDSHGRVHFSSPDPKGTGTLATDQLDRWVIDTLAAHAQRIGFEELPAEILASEDLCPFKVTDHPGIRLATYGASAKRVDYYTGCYLSSAWRHRAVAPQLTALKAFAARTDSLTRAERWVQEHVR